MPLDHFSITVPEGKLDEVIQFLTSALGHTGFKEIMRPVPTVVGMGEQVPYLWIAAVSMEGITEAAQERHFRGMHVAFAAQNVKQVKQFYTSAMRSGAIDNGKPGRRPQYHPGYYGAFVRDPVCQINFEMVFHGCPMDEEGLKRMEEEAEEE